MDGSLGPPPGVTGKLHGLSLTFLQYAKSRLELLQYEWDEEKTRLGKVLARGTLLAFSISTTVQLAAAFVVVAFWETAWRLHAVGVLVLLFAGLSFWAWRSVSANARQATEPFASSIKEFEKDRDALQRLVHDVKQTASDTASTASTAATAAAGAVSAVSAATRAGRPVPQRNSDEHKSTPVGA